MSIGQKTHINYDLELLRGFAALIVIIGHIFYHNQYFDPSYLPKVVKNFIPPANLAVLIFFILSGYVIGLSHKEKLSGKKILLYLKKRFVRIYPIYFIAMSFAFLIAEHHYSGMDMLANFTLTQNIAHEVIWQNNPAWSLNYEVLYYIVFVVISYFRIKSLIAFVLCMLIGITAKYIAGGALISSYCIGYCFWLAGLFMATNLKNSLNAVKVTPLLIYILGIDNIIGRHFYIKKILGNVIHIPQVSGRFWAQNMIQLDDLLYIPYLFMIVLYFSGRTFKYQKQLFILLQLFPLYCICITCFRHVNTPVFNVGVAYLALALLLYFIPTRGKIIKSFGIKLGSISYGIYIIHFPILFLFGCVTAYSNGIVFYTIRIMLLLSITTLVAWLLESKVQPLIKNLFFNKSSTAQFVK